MVARKNILSIWKKLHLKGKSSSLNRKGVVKFTAPLNWVYSAWTTTLGLKSLTVPNSGKLLVNDKGVLREEESEQQHFCSKYENRVNDKKHVLSS